MKLTVALIWQGWTGMYTLVVPSLSTKFIKITTRIWGHPNSRFKIQDPKIPRSQDPKIQKSRSRNQNSEIKIQKSKFRNQDKEIKIQKSRFGNQDPESLKSRVFNVLNIFLFQLRFV